MNQFADRPFVAGSLIGIRSFRIYGSTTGILVSPQRATARAWTCGENIAECRPLMSHSLVQEFGEQPLREHQVASMGCQCGFYAYFDRGSNPYHSVLNVLGLIEGYGVATVGSRGFRCEKARIVALIGQPEQFKRYPGIPVFPDVDSAVTEFPLTVPEGTPVTPSPDDLSSAIRNLTVQMQPFVDAMKKAAEALSKLDTRLLQQFQTAATSHGWVEEGPVEDPQARALRLRQTRNTGPDDKRGIDGIRRRQ